jgi:hypothetical protein
MGEDQRKIENNEWEGYRIVIAIIHGISFRGLGVEVE